MPKSATDVMQEILVSAVLDSIVALKGASKGVPNVLLRDLNAVHANTAPDDLPAEMRAALAASVRDAFGRLRKEGYIVSPANMAPPPPPKPRPRPQGAGKPPVVERTRRPVPRGKGPPPKR